MRDSVSGLPRGQEGLGLGAEARLSVTTWYWNHDHMRSATAGLQVLRRLQKWCKGPCDLPPLQHEQLAACVQPQGPGS